jgi:hypothetical protein
MRRQFLLIFVLGILVGIVASVLADRRPALPTSGRNDRPQERASTLTTSPGAPHVDHVATATPTHTHSSTAAGEGSTCGLAQVAFCDTFDSPSPGGRAGDLDERRWSVARLTQNTNPSQGSVNPWPATTAMHCKDPMSGVLPPNDYFICGVEYGESNHFMEAFDDQGSYTFNSARIRQPFDFAGRTGTIAFDVDAKSAGHGWWIELWLADEPVPAPYQVAPGIATLPRNGLGIALMDQCGTTDASRANVGGLWVVQNYQIVVDLEGTSAPQVGPCFTTQADVFNHIEVRVSPSRVEVWVSDAGGANFQLRAALDAPLPFTRGFVSLQHVSYNAAKAGVTAQQTYHWDNVGFDGPVLPTPRAYDIPLAMSGDPQAPNLGYLVQSDGMRTCCPQTAIAPFTLSNVDLTGATAARLNLNVWNFTAGTSLLYRFNGGSWRSYPHPFPDSTISWRALSIPVALSDLRAGTNTLELQSSGPDLVAANLDLTIELAAGSSSSR